MNRYNVRIPYDYRQYGNMTCEVYANSEEEAEELAYEYDNRHNEDYNDGDSDSTEYDYDGMTVSLDEEDVVPPDNPYVQTTPKRESSHLVVVTEFISDLVLV